MEIILENDRKSPDPTRANNTLSAQNGESEGSESFEHPPILNGNTTARPGGDMARPNKPPKTGKQQRSTEFSYLSQGMCLPSDPRHAKLMLNAKSTNNNLG